MFRKSNFLTARVAYFFCIFFFFFHFSSFSAFFPTVLRALRVPRHAEDSHGSHRVPRHFFRNGERKIPRRKKFIINRARRALSPCFSLSFFFLRIDKALPPRRNLIPTISPTCCPRTRTIALSSSFFLSYSSFLSLSFFFVLPRRKVARQALSRNRLL